MGESLWTVFCGSTGCSSKIGKISSSGFLAIICPCSCLNHILFGVCLSGFGDLDLGEKLIEENTILPLHGWLVNLLQGFAWFFLGLAVRFLCVTSFWEAIVSDAVSVKMILDVISFPGAILSMFSTFSGPKYAGTDSEIDGAGFYTPLPGEGGSGGDKINSDASLPPFQKAGLISRLSFWWLNSLIKKGKEKTLEDKDIPQLRREDRAEMCYSMFMEQQNKQKKQAVISLSFHFVNYIVVQWKQILFSGFYALIKVLTLSTGPLFLRAFILVAEGKEAFEYEAIYQKQLKLSNAAKGSYSPGQIINFVTIDAYKIGEIPVLVSPDMVNKPPVVSGIAILLLLGGACNYSSSVCSNIDCSCKLSYGKVTTQVPENAHGNSGQEAEDFHRGTYKHENSEAVCLGDSFQECHRRVEERGIQVVIISSVTERVQSDSVLVLSHCSIGGYFLGMLLSWNYSLCYQCFHIYGKFTPCPGANKNKHVRKMCNGKELEESIFIKSNRISWEDNTTRATLRNITLVVKPGEKVAICGEVGSGKSTLLAAVLGEVPHVNGIVRVYGKIAYVSQTAWIPTGTIRENILFGSAMDPYRYREAIEKCALVKDLEMLPFGDLTEIGERGVNLSGGQKQRVQLARALYQDADVYLLDDPFSAVDAHTATSLFNEYVMGALSTKTVILVTHQVDFLPAFDSVLLMSEGEILQAATFEQLMHFSQEFQDLVNAHNATVGSERQPEQDSTQKSKIPKGEIQKIYTEKQLRDTSGEQLIKKEEREIGDTGLKPYLQYLKYSKDSCTSFWQLYLMSYSLLDSWCKTIGLEASQSIFSTLLSFFFKHQCPFMTQHLWEGYSVGYECLCQFWSVGYSCLELVFVILPTIYLSILIQRYYFAAGKELMRINGTTKSFVASHLSESIAGAMTIRAFGDEDRHFSKNLGFIDINASPFFYSFTANEWLIQRLEILCAIVLSSSALALTLIHTRASKAGFIGMALSYGLSVNVFLVFSVQSQCLLANMIVSVERLEQFMNIPSEAPAVMESYQPPLSWPAIGEVEIYDLKVKYRPNAPLVLQGISCKFGGGQKIGIVGRTGSGKTTLISTLFRLVEPTEGQIIIDGINISTIGLHDLRSRLGIIPQEPTLFSGAVRYNLDPLSLHTDEEIWEVLEKCQLRGAVQEKEEGLDSLVVQDGSNWSMGQRQLFCLGRALLKRSRILVLDEATASIDNATDSILQKTIRTEFADCTVITVAHRIPTVMDCTMVLAISDGKLVEYDEPMKLIKNEGSLFGQLVKEYWSRSSNGGNTSEDWL
ncbi:ABC transporter C family member 10 [Vitis vinifera]|uniref:ABC-type xenobiotic transporter n=1 Tax=Vitis vinifera TaxID=29760 RepID=A0A438E6D0_VITVI|nr:ABC transporter C family member 10 [Vitis vinifera]